MSCLNVTGNRPKSFQILKFLSLLGFVAGSSQLFALFFYFFRILSYLMLSRDYYQPQLLPKRISLFAFDLLQFDSSSSSSVNSASDNSTLIHVIQAVASSIGAIVLGTLGTSGICREKVALLRWSSLVLLVITFFSGFGGFTLPNLIPTRLIVLPTIGGTMATVSAFGFSHLAKRQLKKEISRFLA